jgi:hypothetical protein
MANCVLRESTLNLVTVIHWGQRKLLMCEMEFLTKYGQLAPLVVYAGAGKINADTQTTCSV